MYNFSRNFGLLAAKMYSHIIYYYVTGTKISAEFLNVYINSLLPVSRYINTAIADKGSNQKKNLKPKCPDTSKFGLLGKPTKTRVKSIILIRVWGMQIQK